MKKREVKKPIKRTMSISNIVLDWCKEMVKDYVSTIFNLYFSTGLQRGFTKARASFLSFLADGSNRDIYSRPSGQHSVAPYVITYIKNATYLTVQGESNLLSVWFSKSNCSKSTITCPNPSYHGARN